jgi:hypothetical protein
MVIHTLDDTNEDILEKAVLSIINDYRYDRELPAIASLDMENFH